MRTSFALACFLTSLALPLPARAQFCPGANGWVFDDVPASDLFCSYITWAAQNGVTQGCLVIDANHRLYCPNDGVTRSQMAAFANRLTTQPDSTSAGVGTITKPGGAFLHNFGDDNTFLGVKAGNFSLSGGRSVGVGVGALGSTTTGDGNTALGAQALAADTTGSTNLAAGAFALTANTGGSINVALGTNALFKNTLGNGNVAVGVSALLLNTIGAYNTAIGFNAGSAVTAGLYNIHIANAGASGDDKTTRIGEAGNQTRTFVAGIRGATTGINNAVNVVIDTNGQLGTISSSRAAKDDIADMSDASAGLMHLRPVTFHYKADHDPAGPRLQYGLIAEEVAEVYPGIVASKDGRPETIMYQYLAPMLLNEYQKQQRTIDAQAAEIAELRRAVESLMARRAPD